MSETASPGRRRRRRQLGFADAETQIGKLEMKNRLTNTDDITQQFVSNSNLHITHENSVLIIALLSKEGQRKQLACTKNRCR